MPIIIQTPIRRLSQAEFGELAYAVMGCVFEIHSEFGRFFDEKIYKRELAQRFPGVGLEVPIEVTYASFTKLQYLDLLIYEEAVTHFLGGELRVLSNVEVLTPEHTLGHQKMRLAAPRVAFTLTALAEADLNFESHLRRLHRHTDLEAILWANIALKKVTFTTIR